VGPLFGGVLYAQVAHPAPYWCGTLIIGLAIVCIFLTIPMLRTCATAPAIGTETDRDGK
jgi:predicted MFS family arabinose efflux permease